MKVIALKMITGEDVVARLESTKFVGEFRETDAYVIDKPFVLHVQHTPQGMAMGLAPWTLANPGMSSLTVPASSVLVMYDVDAGVEQQYLQQTSGIDLSVPGRR